MEVESTAAQTTLGEFLQKAREKRGFSVEYVADHLKLKISTVKALEANDYHETGGLVYVRGYLRSYAKLLNVNIDQALEEIKDGSELLTTAKHEQGTSMPKSNNDNFALWAVGIIIVLLTIAVYVWHHHHNKTLEAQSIASPVAVANTVNHPQDKEPVPPASKPAEAVTINSSPAPSPAKDEAKPVVNKVDVDKVFDPNVKPSIKSFTALSPSADASTKDDNASSQSTEDEEPNNNSPE
jgi:cytoskeleton protein RodZ